LSPIRGLLLPLEVEVRLVPSDYLRIRDSPKVRRFLALGTIIRVVAPNEACQIFRSNRILPNGKAPV